jgi:hypothetical protein
MKTVFFSGNYKAWGTLCLETERSVMEKKKLQEGSGAIGSIFSRLIYSDVSYYETASYK